MSSANNSGFGNDLVFIDVRIKSTFAKATVDKTKSAADGSFCHTLEILVSSQQS